MKELMLCISGTEDGGEREYFIGFYPDKEASLEQAVRDFDPLGLFSDENDDMGQLDYLTYFKVPKEIGEKLAEACEGLYEGSIVDAACGRTMLTVAQQFSVTESMKEPVEVVRSYIEIEISHKVKGGKERARGLMQDAQEEVKGCQFRSYRENERFSDQVFEVKNGYGTSDIGCAIVTFLRKQIDESHFEVTW